MKIEELVNTLENNRNPENAKAMKAYMKERFEFIGLKSPERKALTKTFLRTLKKLPFSYEIFESIWYQKEREYQYIALEYLKSKERTLELEDLSRLEKYITDRSWWDTVDSFHSVIYAIGNSTKSKTNSKEGYNSSKLMKSWSKSDNIWLRRLSIIHQLKAKEETDLELLTYTIKQNLNTEEFFLNKAIGWALREYSKTNRDFVKSFIDENRHLLSNLSIREASKYL
ncbi:DNA alkylation repair protein [Lagierella sp.]|uniref:DNA alkylation repair protein n=1 Tax=Lagierella sp. TaxID=2849657 RepID=UPI00260D02C9|nr:DNA alkylation repair protein [Lagierella sp.]